MWVTSKSRRPERSRYYRAELVPPRSNEIYPRDYFSFRGSPFYRRHVLRSAAYCQKVGNVSLANGLQTREIDIAVGAPPQYFAFLPSS